MYQVLGLDLEIRVESVNYLMTSPQGAWFKTLQKERDRFRGVAKHIIFH